MFKTGILSFLFIASTVAYAQDPTVNLKLFDAKVYSLKNKGVKDFVVDVSSSKLAQQINNQGTFGNVKDLFFRVYWTLSPERLDIEVMGMPEGFKELKEELKLSILGQLENIMPMPIEKRFAAYKFSLSGPGQYLAKDSSGVADVPSFLIKLDDQNRLTSIDAQKPVGTLKISPTYEKDSFSEGRWVLKKQVTEAQENGQSVTTVKTLSYGAHNGMTVVKSVTIATEQKFSRPEQKPVSFSETIEFKNYKIDHNEAMKHFIKDLPAAQ